VRGQRQREEIKMDDADVFVYTGAGGAEVPDDVVRVRFDPSVTSIPARAFWGRKMLAEVELYEGVVEIGYASFGYCDHSITKINIPASLRRINDFAFNYALRTPVRLHDGIENIGKWAFAGCIFTNFRIPPLITVMSACMIRGCKSIFSLELPSIITEIGNEAFSYCYCLRNVAFPPDAVFDDNILIGTGTDLHQLFGSISEIIRELSHRFVGLPIHSIVYYQSYNQEVLQNLIAVINLRSSQRLTLRSKLDTTGNQQDCLGMTPLHILACSSVHDLELYRLIVEKYPANLITEDRWGALPLLYAFWGAAPAEIIQFLLESYQLYYPDHIFNWTMMVETMGRTDTPKERIENLLCVKEMHYPKQSIDWVYLLNKFSNTSSISSYASFLTFREQMQFLVMCSMSDRVEALAFKLWRDHIANMIYTAPYKYNEDNRSILNRIQEKLAYFEDEMPKLKEATTILELALWKNILDVNSKQMETNCCQMKMRSDESDVRRQCRVTCGADVVIGHVMPFLIDIV
jgi:hypothetical protein